MAPRKTPQDRKAQLEAVKPTPAMDAAQALASTFGPMLDTIIGQLDLLVRLECGDLLKADMRTRLEEHRRMQAEKAEQLAETNAQEVAEDDHSH
jgi:hypothetical protein